MRLSNCVTSTNRGLQPMFWLMVAVTTFVGAFVLPFAFPLRQQVYSPAYTAGGNNRAGAFAVAIIGMAVTLTCWRTNLTTLPKSQAPPPGRMGRSCLWLAMAAVTAVTGLLGYCVVRSGSYYADSGYFLTQLRSGLVFHGVIYRDFEFAYGPLLYLWPATFVRVLAHVGIYTAAAYMVSLVTMEILGVWMLFATVSVLPITHGMKRSAFLLLTFLSLDPQAGLNYTPVRFILPSAGVLLLSRQRAWQKASLWAAAIEMIQFAVSPELGVAFGTAAAAYGLYQAFVVGSRWLMVGVAAIVGGVCFAVISGPDYFRTMREFAKGGYNLILEPAPHILVLLFCAVCLAPLVVASALRSDRVRTNPAASEAPAAGGMLLGLYVGALAMLAPALGRCDPLHVSFNGWGLFLLAFVAIDRFRTRWKITALAMAAIFCVYSVSQEYAVGKGPILRGLRGIPDPYENADLPDLEPVLGTGTVAFPWNTPMTLIDRLTQAREFQPQYLCVMAIDQAAEERTVTDMRKAVFAMVPNGIPLVTENPINNLGLKYKLRLDYRYKARRAPFLQGAGTFAELKANWASVGHFGSYTLYRKLR